jgi:hypothetical protein
MGDPVAPATDLVGSLQERAERVGQTRFLGCPIAEFESGGRMMFEVLLREGLAPSSRVLDVGCGALRLGYWVMRFLDPGCYFGIEPNVEMRELGLELIEPDVINRAQPSFSEDTSFDFSVFGERFDARLLCGLEHPERRFHDLLPPRQRRVGTNGAPSATAGS